MDRSLQDIRIGVFIIYGLRSRVQGSGLEPGPVRSWKACTNSPPSGVPGYVVVFRPAGGHDIWIGF